MCGSPSFSFLRYEPLKNEVTNIDPFCGLKTRFRHFPTRRDCFFWKNEKLDCFNIQCVAEASSSSLNYNMTLESKENYPWHTKTVQNLLCARSKS